MIVRVHVQYRVCNACVLRFAFAQTGFGDGHFERTDDCGADCIVRLNFETCDHIGDETPVTVGEIG